MNPNRTRSARKARVCAGVLGLCCASTAFTASAQTYHPVPFPPPQIDLLGFSVTPRSGERWVIKSGHTPRGIEFYRSTEGGRNHTVLAWVEILDWSNTHDTADDVVRHIAKPMSQSFQNESRFSRLKLEFPKSRLSNMDCSELSFSVEDRGVPYAPGQVFTIAGWEIYCLHPKSGPRLVLKLAHSQRHLHGAQTLALDTELDRFRRGARVRALTP